MPDRPRAQGNGFNGAGTTGARKWTSRASPEPPPAKHRRTSLGSRDSALGFAFGWKRNAHPWRGTGVPRLGCSTANGKAARWRAGWRRAGRRPRVLADRAFARCRCQSAREAMASTACRSPFDPRVARRDTQVSLRAERNTRPWAWPDPTEAGDPQGRYGWRPGAPPPTFALTPRYEATHEVTTSKAPAGDGTKVARTWIGDGAREATGVPHSRACAPLLAVPWRLARIQTAEK